MSKRKRRRSQEELPLFDLPLTAADEPSPPAAAEPLDDPDDRVRDAAAGRREVADLELATVSTPAPAAAGAPVPQPAEPRPVAVPGAEAGADAAAAADGEAERVASPVAPVASFGDRLLSGLVDLGIHLAVLGATVGAVLLMGVPLALGDWPPFAVLGLAFSFLYWVVPLAFWGQTPGMAWINHTARNLDDQPLTFGQTVMRWLGALLTAALAGLPLVLALTGSSLSDRLSQSRTRAV